MEQGTCKLTRRIFPFIWVGQYATGLYRIAAFSDEMRDGLRGGWDDDTKGAFLVGVPSVSSQMEVGSVFIR